MSTDKHKDCNDDPVCGCAMLVILAVAVVMFGISLVEMLR